MYCSAEIKEVEELEPTNILPQTPFWARIKIEQGFIPGGFHLTVSEDLLAPNKNQNQNIHDDLLVLIRYIDKRCCFAYVPYGPKLEPRFENHGVFLEELSEALRPYLPKNCVFIRYDLMWENQWAEEDEFFDDRGNWLGPPPAHTQELRLNFNTHN
jgi:hypothetical protein